MKIICILVAAALPLVCAAQRQGQNQVGPTIGYEYRDAVVAAGMDRAWAMGQFRLLDGKTNRLSDPGWVRMDGVVFQNTRGGMIMSWGGEDVFVLHPPRAADKQPVTAWAKEIPELYTYNTVGGSTRTLRKFDCGIPVDRPPPPRELPPRPLDETEKAEMAERVLKYHIEMADKGLPSFQFLMGERYQFGRGVTQNLETAKSWFEKAAAQGDTDAKRSLTNHFSGAALSQK